MPGAVKDKGVIEPPEKKTKLCGVVDRFFGKFIPSLETVDCLSGGSCVSFCLDMLSRFAVMIVGVALIFPIGCKAGDSLEMRRAQAVELARKLVAQDAAHSISADLSLTRDPKAGRHVRDEASKRTDQNCKDFAKLRPLIDVGRPLSDYAPIEKLGKFEGANPNRSFVYGIGGFVTEQGPEPYLTKVDVDSNNRIKKVGPIVEKE